MNFSNQITDRHNNISIKRSIQTNKIACIGIDMSGCMYTQNSVFIMAHRIMLFLKFIHIRPIVISFTQRHILPGCQL